MVTRSLRRLLAVLPVICAFVTAQKQTDTRVDLGRTAGTAAALAPALVMSGTTAYAAFQDDRLGTAAIYFTRSLDGGRSWLPSEVRLDTSPSLGAHDVRIGADGDLVGAVWVRDTSAGSDIRFNRSLDRGATWLANDVRLDPGAGANGFSYSPCIALQGATVAIAWIDSRTGIPEVFFNRTLNSGATWLATETRIDVGNAPGQVFNDEPDIALFGNIVCVAWSDTRHTGTDVFLNRSLDAGTTWLANDVQLNGGPHGATAARPRVRVGPLDVVAVWEDYRNGIDPDIYAAHSGNGGTTWPGANRRLDLGAAPGSSGSFAPQIVMLAQDVFVAWSDNRNGLNNDVYYSRSSDGGATWLAADLRLNTGVPPGTADASHVRIAAAGSLVAAAWIDNRASLSGNVFANRSVDGGVTWASSDQRLDLGRSPGLVSSSAPQVATDGASSLVVWEDYRTNFVPDIYCNLELGYETYGVGLAGNGGLVPALVGAGPPAPGQIASFGVLQGNGGAPGILGIGFLPSTQIDVPLFGGTLLVLPSMTITFVLGGAAGQAGTGSVVVPVPVPNVSTLLGLNANIQAGVLDAGAVQQVALSNAIALWIG